MLWHALNLIVSNRITQYKEHHYANSAQLDSIVLPFQFQCAHQATIQEKERVTVKHALLAIIAQQDQEILYLAHQENTILLLDLHYA